MNPEQIAAYWAKQTTIDGPVGAPPEDFYWGDLSNARSELIHP